MAHSAQFLTLSPTSHVIIASSTAVVAPAAETITAVTAVEIPVVEKNRRSSSVTTDNSSVSPRSSIDAGLTPAEAPVRFLKLGH